MTFERRLKVVEPQAPTAALAAQFTREITTPAGPPWRQRQAAELDARLGAPVASGAGAPGLSFRVARCEPWRLGQAGRFAVVYTRGGLPAASSALQDSEPSSGERVLAALENPRVRSLLALGVTLLSLVLFGLAVSAALTRRADIGGDLVALDGSLTPLEHRARQLAGLDRQTAALDSVGGRDRSVAKVLSDVDWVAVHRKADVAVANLHWLHGVTAVETASPDSPFAAADRPVQRATHALRPGVWLWGVAGKDASR